MQFRRMLSFHTFTVRNKRIMGWGIPVKYLGCTNFLGGHNLGPGAKYLPVTQPSNGQKPIFTVRGLVS